MEHKIKQALDQVRAPEALKQNTRSYLERHRRKPRRKMWQPLLATACALLLFSGAGYNIWQAWMRPVAFISIDVNPSVELDVNSRDKVVGARAFNEAGARQLELLSPKGMSYQTAVTLLLEQEVADGYLTDTGMVAFAVQAGDTGREQQMLSTLDGCVQALPLEVRHHGCAVDEQVRGKALEEGISPGRYQAILDLMEVDPTATWEGCHNNTMSELLERTERCGGMMGGMGHGKGSGHHGRN